IRLKMDAALTDSCTSPPSPDFSLDSSSPFQTKKMKTKALPPVKYLEGEVIWAKFNRRPWWPCQKNQIVLPYISLCDYVSEPPNRTNRQYFLKTFGEPEEQAWVPERSTHIFVGGYQFNNLPFVRGSGRQQDENTRHSVISETSFQLNGYYF
uniref:PWWP domain-containing protein n=1 Tax=Sinocyclocheilus rhinocerous TaxID=307959 RepID=A0A673G3W7_9TELE